MNSRVSTKSLKAVGLISGGLDSTLAVKIVQRLGVDVHAMHFVLPWLTRPGATIVDVARQLKIPLEISFCKEEFLSMVKDPKHGYGVAMNPCIDCHIYQLQKAKEYMLKLGADFVFTGEVLGQRPMSQNRHQLYNIEKESGLQGKLLRPLSAKLLDPTIIEMDGRVDREKLFAISGRSRSDLLRLAKEFNVQSYIPTGGGCLLTDKNFSKRLKDLFAHGYQDAADIILLSLGRHFRLSDHHKAIVGRDEAENTRISEQARPSDILFQLEEFLGPLVILQGGNPPFSVIEQAASLVRRFSKFRDKVVTVAYWRKDEERDVHHLQPADISEDFLEKAKIEHK